MRLAYALLLAALFALGAARAHAQITLTDADVRAQLVSPSGTPATVDDYYIDATPQEQAVIDALAAQEGANQTWDFTAFATIVHTTVTRSELPVAPPAPGASDPYLAQANLLVLTDAGAYTDYAYYQLTPSALVRLGNVSPDGGVESVTQYHPGDPQLVLPLTYGASWASDGRYAGTSVAPFDSITYHIERGVVGWGTLLVGGASLPALMLRTVTTTRLWSTEPGGPTSIDDVGQKVEWMTAAGVEAHATLSFGALRASYTVRADVVATAPGVPAAGFALEPVAPNPVRGSARVGFTLAEAGPARLAVYDLLGREVAVLQDGTLAAGPHEAVWEASGVAPGVYVVRLASGSGQAVQRVTVAR